MDLLFLVAFQLYQVNRVQIDLILFATVERVAGIVEPATRLFDIGAAQDREDYEQENDDYYWGQ